MRQIITLYFMFRDLASDIRAVTVDMQRASSFQERAEKFFKTFKRYSSGSCTGKKPYLHILREHISEFMEFWSSIGYGYGYFNCNAGEHLNKRVKTLELHNTNLDTDRVASIARIIRLKQFHFPESIYKSKQMRLYVQNVNRLATIKKQELPDAS